MHSHHPLDASPAASVVLDIGNEVGALILYRPAADHGREIEISRGTDVRTHSAVRERFLASGSIFCAVYPSLPAGAYTIWTDDDTPGGTATVTGGMITEVDWTSAR
jgi:hypothetical protein